VLKGHTGGVRKVAFLPHGGGGGGGGECVGTVGTRAALNVLSCALDGTLRVWKWRGKPTAVSTVLEGHGKAVSSFCVLGMHPRPTGLTEAVHVDEQATFAGCPRVLTASTDRSARLFDLHSGRCVAVLEGHPGDVAAVAACALGAGGATAAERVASAVVATGSFNFLALWDVRCPQRPVAQLHRAAGSMLAGVRMASTSNVRLSPSPHCGPERVTVAGSR
jgi:WD40 repeat protein